MTKECSTCSAVKPYNLFYPKFSHHPQYADSAAGYTSDCRECCKEARREYIALNPDKKKTSDRAYHVTKYGISVVDYNRMFSEQNGGCIGCSKHQSELSRRLCIDHCHRTGQVRGLLCHNCNALLGMAKDNVETLHNLITYLRTNSESAEQTDVGNVISLRKQG